MNQFRVQLRCIRYAWLEKPLFVEISAYGPKWVDAAVVIATVEARWKTPWVVVGIERVA